MSETPEFCYADRRIMTRTTSFKKEYLISLLKSIKISIITTAA